MTDFSKLQSLFSKPEQEFLFKDSQPRYLNDNNKGSYGSGMINIDTSAIGVDEYSVPSDYTVLVPMVINVSGILSVTNCLGVVEQSFGNAGPATVDLNGKAGSSNTGGTLTLASKGSVAFKLSSLNAFTGINMQLVQDGTTLVSDTKNIALINSIRMLIDHNLEWDQQHASDLCFAKNTSSFLPNKGFETRQKYLYNLSKATYYYLPGVNFSVLAPPRAYISRLEFCIEVPLKMLHNLVANMDFPVRGVPLRIDLLLSKEFSQNSEYYAFDYATTIPDTVKYSVGNASVAGVDYTSCQLRFNALTLPPAMSAKVSVALNSGVLKQRKVKFASTQIFDDMKNTSNSLTSYKIGNGIVNPIRAWLIGTQVNSLKSQTSPFITNLNLKNLNAFVNTRPRYTSSLTTPFAMYDIVKEQMNEGASSNDKGSLLNFNDFYVSSPNQFTVVDNASEESQGNYSFYCLDFSRLQGRVPDTANEILIESLKTATTATDLLDYYIVLERESTLDIKYGDNSVRVTVGSF